VEDSDARPAKNLEEQFSKKIPTTISAKRWKKEFFLRKLVRTDTTSARLPETRMQRSNLYKKLESTGYRTRRQEKTRGRVEPLSPSLTILTAVYIQLETGALQRNRCYLSVRELVKERWSDETSSVFFAVAVLALVLVYPAATPSAPPWFPDVPPFRSSRINRVIDSLE